MRENEKDEKIEREGGIRDAARVANVRMINRSQLGKYVSYIRRVRDCMYNCAPRGWDKERSGAAKAGGRKIK